MAGDGHDGPAFTTGPEAWREAEALARRVLDPAGNVGGRVRFNLAPPLVEDLGQRIAAEAAALAAENARLRGECARLAEERGLCVRAANTLYVAVGVFREQCAGPAGEYRAPGLGAFLAADEGERAFEAARRVVSPHNAAGGGAP